MATVRCVTIGCIMTLALGLVAGSLRTEAQQAKKVSRIGYLAASPPSAHAGRSEAFRQGLHELGYVEGKQLSLCIDMQGGNSIGCPTLRQSSYCGVPCLILSEHRLSNSQQRASFQRHILRASTWKLVGS